MVEEQHGAQQEKESSVVRSAREAILLAKREILRRLQHG
jgi:hypothetical protein